MQYGSLIRAERRRGADVWEWREPGSDGSRRDRHIVVDSVDQYEQRQDALRTITALQREINQTGTEQRNRAIKVQELFDHHCQRELADGNTSKTSATKNTYDGHVEKWVCPRWGSLPLARVRAGEVETTEHDWPRIIRFSASAIRYRTLIEPMFT